MKSAGASPNQPMVLENENDNDDGEDALPPVGDTPRPRRFRREEFMGDLTYAEAMERALGESARSPDAPIVPVAHNNENQDHENAQLPAAELPVAGRQNEIVDPAVDANEYHMDIDQNPVDWEDVIDKINEQSPTKGMTRDLESLRLSPSPSEASSATAVPDESPIKRKFEGFEEPGEPVAESDSPPKRGRMFDAEEELLASGLTSEEDELEADQALQDAIRETAERSPSLSQISPGDANQNTAAQVEEAPTAPPAPQDADQQNAPGDATVKKDEDKSPIPAGNFATAATRTIDNDDDDDDDDDIMVVDKEAWAQSSQARVRARECLRDSILGNWRNGSQL